MIYKINREVKRLNSAECQNYKELIDDNTNKKTPSRKCLYTKGFSTDNRTLITRIGRSCKKTTYIQEKGSWSGSWLIITINPLSLIQSRNRVWRCRMEGHKGVGS